MSSRPDTQPRGSSSTLSSSLWSLLWFRHHRHPRFTGTSPTSPEAGPIRDTGLVRTADLGLTQASWPMASRQKSSSPSERARKGETLWRRRSPRQFCNVFCSNALKLKNLNILGIQWRIRSKAWIETGSCTGKSTVRFSRCGEKRNKNWNACLGRCVPNTSYPS